MMVSVLILILLPKYFLFILLSLTVSGTDKSNKLCADVPLRNYSLTHSLTVVVQIFSVLISVHWLRN